jgi:hypothetical protein
MNRDAKVRRNANVVARELAKREGGVLLHLGSGAYHGMNPVGLVIWELLDGEQTISYLIEGVRARVANPPPQLDQDVMAFIQSAVDRDLIHVVE